MKYHLITIAIIVGFCTTLGLALTYETFAAIVGSIICLALAGLLAAIIYGCVYGLVRPVDEYCTYR